MKQTLLILALITSTIQTFAQSPRIKLNQITKDTVKGSVLISSPSDSGMVYSRDLFISYGADTFLILGGDTLAATSSIISSVLSDGVTVTGDGTTGNELRVDTATVISTIQGLVDTLTNRGYLTANQTITLSGDVTGSGTTAITATVVDDSHNHIISNIDFLQDSLDAKANDSDLANYVTLSGAETITGAKTFSSTVTGTSNLRAPKIQVGTSATINDVTGVANTLQLTNYTPTAFVTGSADNYIYKNSNGFGGLNAHSLIFQTRSDIDGGGFAFVGGSTPSAVVTIFSSGDVGIGTTSPGQKLEVNGKVKISDLTGTGGNAVYENGGVLGVASDARFKSHIADLDNGIEKILNLKPKYFIDNRNSAFQQLGFYAQEVKSVINEASYPIGNTEYLGINDRAIIAVTVKAIQEQQTIILTQEQKITDLETTIQALITRIEILENK